MILFTETEKFVIMKNMTELRKNLYDSRVAGVVYSAATVIVLALSLLFSVVLVALHISYGKEDVKPDWFLYCSYLIPQLAFLLTIVLFFVFTAATPRQLYRGTKPKYFLIAVLLQFGLFSLSGLNGIFLNWLHELTGYISFSAIPSTEGWRVIPVIFVIAVLPALFEESIFRGILLNPMKNFSTAAAVLLSGALFALYHQSPAQTVYQFCCGCAFALVAIRADSVLPTMLSHFLNNAVIIILSACGINNFSGTGGIIFYVVSAIALVAVLGYLLFFDKKSNTKKTESLKPFLLTASVGMAVCTVLWIANLLSGS